MNGIISQTIVFLLVGIFFFLGIYCRNVLGHRSAALRGLEISAVFIAGFLFFALPLTRAIYCVLVDSGSDLIAGAFTLVPVFSAGFLARSSLQKLLKETEQAQSP